MAALIAVAGAGVQLGSAVSARHRAEAAADLAVVAVAAYAIEGAELACARAGVVATRMNVAVSVCRLDGWDAVLEVEAATPIGLAHARARAGPVAPG